MSGTISTFHLSRSSAVKPSIRVRLDSTSGLPPLKAATTRIPGTWSGLEGSFNTFVNAMTCEVSKPNESYSNRLQATGRKHSEPLSGHQVTPERQSLSSWGVSRMPREKNSLFFATPTFP